MAGWKRYGARTNWRSRLGLIGAVCLLSVASAHAAEAPPMAGPQQRVATVTEEVQIMHTRYLAAFDGRNAAAVAALFTSDAIFVDGAGAATTGRDAIEAMFEQAFDGGDVVLEARADRIETLGDGALEIGHGAQVTNGRDGARKSPFHYTAVCTREGGLLKLRLVSLGTE